MRFSFAIDRDKKTFIFYYAGEKGEIITLTPCKAFKGVFVGRNWKKKQLTFRGRQRESRDVKVVSFITNVIFWPQLGKLFNRYEGNWIFCSYEVFFKYSVQFVQCLLIHTIWRKVGSWRYEKLSFPTLTAVICMSEDNEEFRTVLNTDNSLGRFLFTFFFTFFAGYHCVTMVVVCSRVLWLALWTITVTFVSSYNQYSPLRQCPATGRSLL